MYDSSASSVSARKMVYTFRRGSELRLARWVRLALNPPGSCPSVGSLARRIPPHPTWSCMTSLSSGAITIIPLMMYLSLSPIKVLTPGPAHHSKLLQKQIWTLTGVLDIDSDAAGRRGSRKLRRCLFLVLGRIPDFDSHASILKAQSQAPHPACKTGIRVGALA